MSRRIDLSFVLDAEIKTDEPLKKHCSLKVGGNARYFASVKSLLSLREITERAKTVGIHYKIMGNGTNILISDEGYDGLIVSLSGLDRITILPDGKVKVMAGAKLSDLVAFTLLHGLTGAETLFGIPATVGGAVKMNAGAFGGSISDFIDSVEVLSYGKIKRYNADQCGFSYRKSRFNGFREIITAVYFDFPYAAKDGYAEIKKYAELRRSSQPSGRTCGSVFRNPEGDFAGRIIESCGLKGFKIGGAQISYKHANFIVTDANAKASDVRSLIDVVKNEVYDKKGILLKEEVEYLGKFR